MIIQFLKRQIANFLTLTGMILGMFAIFSSIEGNYNSGATFICIAAIFDFFDGRIARKLNITSRFGKYFDSNSDLISFGVAPGLLIYLSVLNQFKWAGVMVSFLFILGGAFRLARYNATEFSGHFEGLPITIAGAVVALFVFAIPFLPPLWYIFITLILFYLMVSTHSFKRIRIW
jgi:CDP-diacylglycerol---serine O-phosphatidyltransferase